MTVHVALLRAVNLGPTNKVSMADLRSFAGELGLGNARTLLNSGNLVFESERTGARLEALLEERASERLGLRTEFVVRTAAGWAEVVKKNPFPEQAKTGPARLLLMACKEAVGKTLEVKGAGNEIVRTSGREIYVVYPDGVGRSKLKLGGVVGTARNWNTVLKLLDAVRMAQK